MTMNFGLHFEKSYQQKAVALFGPSTGRPVQLEGSVVCDGGRWVFEALMSEEDMELWGEMARAKLSRKLNKWDGLSDLPVLDVKAEVLLACQSDMRWEFSNALVQEVAAVEDTKAVYHTHQIKIRLSPHPKPSYHVSFERAAP